jgi:hypothetical protein
MEQSKEQLAVTEYLHLYKGCNVRHNDGWIGRLLGVNETLGRAFQPLKIEAPNGMAVWWDWKDITPILRPLSDMTEEEKTEFLNAVGIEPEDIDCLIKTENPFSGELEFGTAHLTDISQWTIGVHVLLSKHFDLFGLIEAGLAIDATTINNQNLNQ